jgi:hypothetical protein
MIRGIIESIYVSIKTKFHNLKKNTFSIDVIYLKKLINFPVSRFEFLKLRKWTYLLSQQTNCFFTRLEKLGKEISWKERATPPIGYNTVAKAQWVSILV